MTTTNDLLALYKFDDSALAFPDTGLGDDYLRGFCLLGREDRLETARSWLETWNPADPVRPVLFIRADALPAALPKGAVIALAGYAIRYGEFPACAPTLGPDGYPDDPAAVMATMDRISQG